MMSSFKMHMKAQWEIVSMAEFVDEHYPTKQVPDSVLCDLYKGALVPCILGGMIDRKQVFGLTIITTASTDEGGLHTHESAWSFPMKMTFSEFSNGSKGIPIDIGSGIRVPWKGVNEQWLKLVDEDLAGSTVVSAWATCNCMATVSTKGMSPFSIKQLKRKFQKLNAKAVVI
jgi:hypothetical protein